MEKREYAAVDLLKFFFSFCVVAIHAPILDYLPDFFSGLFTRIILNLAVPYFFVAAGFFLGRKVTKLTPETINTCLWSYAKHILTMLVPFLLLQIYQQWVKEMINGYGRIGILKRVLFRSVISPWHLWFLYGLLFCLVLFYPCFKKQNYKSAIVFGFVLYLTNLVLSSSYIGGISDKYNEIFKAPNFALASPVYFAIGLYVAKRFDEIGKTPIKKYVLLFGLSYLLYAGEIIAEYSIAGQYGGYKICLPFVACFLFIVSAKSKIKVNRARFLRSISTSVYLLHMPLLNVINYYSYNKIIAYLFTVTGSVIIGSIYYHLKQKGKIVIKM